MGVKSVDPLLEGEELGNLGLRRLGMTLKLSYVNFVLYFLLFVSGMYVNIFITSGVSTVSVSNFFNLLHMLFAIANFAMTFIIMIVGFVYGMKHVAIFSLGAVVSIVAATAGGVIFLSTGGSRTSGATTLAAGWEMSLLFLLAVFLSYYATLKIMRAVRLLEAYNRR